MRAPAPDVDGGSPLPLVDMPPVVPIWTDGTAAEPPGTVGGGPIIDAGPKGLTNGPLRGSIWAMWP